MAWRFVSRGGADRDPPDAWRTLDVGLRYRQSTPWQAHAIRLAGCQGVSGSRIGPDPRGGHGDMPSVAGGCGGYGIYPPCQWLENGSVPPPPAARWKRPLRRWAMVGYWQVTVIYTATPPPVLCAWVPPVTSIPRPSPAANEVLLEVLQDRTEPPPKLLAQVMTSL